MIRHPGPIDPRSGSLAFTLVNGTLVWGKSYHKDKNASIMNYTYSKAEGSEKVSGIAGGSQGFLQKFTPRIYSFPLGEFAGSWRKSLMALGLPELLLTRMCFSA